MPHTKFQVVFGPDDTVDLHMLIDGEMRATHVNLADAPFSKSLLGEPDVQGALKAWMLEVRGPTWMSWMDVEAALHATGIDFNRRIERFPASAG